MFNIIICDDNNNDRKNVTDIVKKYMHKNKLEYQLHLYTDYDENFFSIVNNKMPFKIYLLDIETPTRSGIDIARVIRKKDIDSVIIFLTAHEELGNIILKNDIMFLSFINKFDGIENRLNESLNKAINQFKDKRMIRFNDRNIVYTLDMNDILYITKDGFERKTIIKTDYSEFKVNNSLIEIVGMLDSRFVQSHRACYINKLRKAKVDKTKRIITFDNGEEIDLLSDKYKKEVANG